MKKITLITCCWIIHFHAFPQSYTSYFTGSNTDVNVTAYGGVCLMGGATDNDEAIKWFLQQANGGDILVLRASGSDGYNNYMYSSLGVSVNSVETIVFNSAVAANEPYIHQKIQTAEAIWFAGGDQWDYVSYWRNTPITMFINDAIQNRNIVIGGTSAGMAIQGGFYFSAQNGTVTSATALSNPYSNNITVDATPFLQNDYLQNVITDTHYDNPDRKGRHVAFLARILTDYGVRAKGIACDEYTAVCIDTAGIARVYGEYPTYDDNAYFIQTNCELANDTPENCTSGNPLDWNLGGEAVKVYQVKGTLTGMNSFDLTNWQSGNGGVWQNWYVNNSTFMESAGASINCCAGVNLTFNFDNSPQQTTWEILDANDLPVASGGNYTGTQGGALLTETTCLPDGCYDLVVYDSANDGMCPRRASSIVTVGSANFGLGGIFNGIPRVRQMCGNYTLTDASGAVLVTGGGRFGSSETSNFCLVNGAAQFSRKMHYSYLQISPNPVRDLLRIDIDIENEAKIELLNVAGEIVQQYFETEINSPIEVDVSDLISGIYLIRMMDGKTVFSTKFIKH